MNQEILDEKAILRKERLYVIILAAIQVVHIMDFVIMMPLGPQFIRAFQITTTQFSFLVASYTISAGVIGFMGALYADHFDRKKFLLFNFTGFIVGTFMCAIAPGYASLMIARIIAGAFGGILNACVLSIVTDLIPFQRRGNAMGVIMSSFSISSVVGVPIGLAIANNFGWHYTFYFICIVAFIFWILSALVLPSLKVRAERLSLKDNLKNFKSILSQKDYLQSFTLTSVLGFGIFMIVPFLSIFMVKNVGILETQLHYIYIAGGLCTVISARLIGKLCDKVGSFRVFKYVAAFSLLPIIILTNLPPLPLALALCATSLFMMTGSGRFIPAMTLVTAVVKPKERGTFMSLENSARQLSSGIASQVAGLIIGSTSAGALTNFNIVGLCGALTSVIAIGIAFRIKTKFNLR
jgi:predicted MFS family arabinose efflux permease